MLALHGSVLWYRCLGGHERRFPGFGWVGGFVSGYVIGTTTSVCNTLKNTRVPYIGCPKATILCISLPTLFTKVMLLGAVLLGRSLEARQRFKAAMGLQRLFDARPDQVGVHLPRRRSSNRGCCPSPLAA